MSQHMLQGAVLAEQDNASEELVAAALLHDIGHYTSEFGPLSDELHDDNFHDEAGARVLEGFFPPVVIECVRLHVAAKRYLCATDPSYYGKLSAASIHTLGLQGGPMNADEKSPSSGAIRISRKRCACGCGTKAARIPTWRRQPSATTCRCCSASSTGTWGRRQLTLSRPGMAAFRRPALTGIGRPG